jgi:hypothetical protein
VVRVNYIVPHAADFEACWPVLRHYLGRARPAATMVSAGLIDPRMKIEIEGTINSMDIEFDRTSVIRLCSSVA